MDDDKDNIQPTPPPVVVTPPPPVNTNTSTEFKGSEQLPEQTNNDED